MTLHDKILNIPCEVDKAKKAINRIEYKNGHRDALVKSARLVIEYDKLLDKILDELDSNRDEYGHICDLIERCKNEK